MQDHHPEWFHGSQSIRLTVVGSVCDWMLHSSFQDWTLTGLISVEELEHHLKTARVFVSPIKYGTGLNTKNVLALSRGIPLVTTPIGGQGVLPDTAEIGQIVGGAVMEDEAEKFVSQIHKIYHDQELWQKMSDDAIQHVAQYFRRQHLDKDIQELMDALYPEGNK